MPSPRRDRRSRKDDRQFDDVVRSLVRHRSRRALVGGLLGGGLALLATHLRMPGAAAGEDYSLQGGPCVDDSQCLVADTPLVCAYNGFGSAGSACCAPVSGSCFDNGDCCGPATFYSGHCWDFTSPSAGEACWQLPGDPDPCVEGLICTHDWQSEGIWGTCQPLFTDAESAGEWCGDHFCESWERCCSQCSGICAPRGAVCPDGQCRSGYACPDDCTADSWCPGCLSQYCLDIGICA